MRRRRLLQGGLGSAALAFFGAPVLPHVGTALAQGVPPAPSFNPIAAAFADFSAPDGLAFDSQGWLWIQTDYGPSMSGIQANMGNCHMMVADIPSGKIGRFLTGPNGCEITGWAITPDQTALFVNIQHPGEGGAANPTTFSTWPDGVRAARSSTIVITKDDGGVIGT
jgi:secreted PhoX family phosphatase